MKQFENIGGINFGSNLNLRQDSLKELIARAHNLEQRWRNEIDDCAAFDFASAANAATAADELEEDFDLFAAYAAAEVDSEYLADLDGLVAVVETTSNEWKEERRKAAAVDLLEPAEDEDNLGFSCSFPVAA